MNPFLAFALWFTGLKQPIKTIRNNHQLRGV